MGRYTGAIVEYFTVTAIYGILKSARDMEELCPKRLAAELFENPQAMICWAISDYTKIKECRVVPETSATWRKTWPECRCAVQ